MTAPEKETPNMWRSAVTDDPRLEGIVMLMLDQQIGGLSGRDLGGL